MFGKLFREPLTYFVVLGALVYYLYVPSVSEQELSAATIKLPGEFVAEQRAKFENQNHHPPTDQELNQLLEAAINEEILFREAWRLQLFVGDEVVRKRMIQKMRFVLEESNVEVRVDASHIDKRMADLKRDSKPTATFDLYHLVFSDADKARRYLDEITHEKNNSPSAKPEGLIAFPLGNVLSQVSVREAERMIGADFAGRLNLETPAQWQGPIKSRYGYHIVKLNEINQHEANDDASTREEIRQEIIREQSERARQKAIEEIKSRYVIAHAK